MTHTKTAGMEGTRVNPDAKSPQAPVSDGYRVTSDKATIAERVMLESENTGVSLSYDAALLVGKTWRQLDYVDYDAMGIYLPLADDSDVWYVPFRVCSCGEGNNPGLAHCLGCPRCEREMIQLPLPTAEAPTATPATGYTCPHCEDGYKATLNGLCPDSACPNSQPTAEAQTLYKPTAWDRLLTHPSKSAIARSIGEALDIPVIDTSLSALKGNVSIETPATTDERFYRVTKKGTC